MADFRCASLDRNTHTRGDQVKNSRLGKGGFCTHYSCPPYLQSIVENKKKEAAV